MFSKKKKVSNSRPKPWITTGIRISCANKRRLYAIYRHSKELNFKLYYKKYCRTLITTINAAKRKYYDEIIEKSTNKNKSVWNIIKKLTNKRNTTNKITAMNVNNNIINDPTIIANAFNNFFSSAAVNLINRSSDDTFTVNPLHFPINNLTGPTFNLSLKPTTSHEINKTIQNMKLKDAHGYDEVSSRTLKISAAFILSPLTYIFNKSLYAGIFPERMKYSIIKPLYKKGSTSELGNYRPISLLTVFSKLLEKIIYKRLYLYLMEHNLLSCQQFGFRENRSTQTATYSLLNTILMALDKHEFVGGLFCDFHKAFDCVNHSILLEQLDYCGISGTAKKLLGSYLDGRYQRVELMVTVTVILVQLL